MANFSDQKIQQVWEKAQTVDSFNKDLYRKDCCGAWMQRDKYGVEELYGWEIDHVYPVSKGGTDDLVNLRPMQWENNRSKADSYPDYTASKTSDGNKNINKEENKTINDALKSELKERYKIK
ncbi:HNH endonuclease [Breznakibacter xylanolyticus]|uniref:HNH endonuclease n=1 Tax=Breznakibacter xylanolyticus TaxID=990 RepID=A0A2W7NKV9_9BACT|nr:HNH endonuclease signature motif containing protein [Breznakibacter xylanolyticus]PZX20113.1 HNH endonuclease [Breznakibacter xylanolyticus]